MKALLVLLVLASGCLIRSDDSSVKKTFDANQESPPSFKNCVDAIGGTKKHPTTGVVEGRFHGCRIYFGHKHTATHQSMLRNQALKVTDNPYGDIDRVQRLMDINKITCEKSKQRQTPYAELIFKFPLNKEASHADYKEVKLRCSLNYDVDEDRSVVSIGFNKDDDTLIFDMRFGTIESGIYHFLDTDSNGVIKKHSKVKGAGGKWEVIFDDYKLQAAE